MMTHTNFGTAETFEPFANLNLLKVEQNSMVPKYAQLVDILLSDIENGIFKIGEMIPSINETCMEFYMAKNTVEKAYKILKDKGVLCSVKGKGYFVASTAVMCTKRVLFVCDHFELGRKKIFQAFKESMPSRTEIDLFIYNNQPELLEKRIVNGRGSYDYFVLLSCLNVPTPGLRGALDAIPKDKLILACQSRGLIQGAHSVLAQNEKENMYQALTSLLPKFKKYKKLKMVASEGAPHQELIEGFVDFGLDNGLRFELLEPSGDMAVHNGDAFIVLEDDDMVGIINNSERMGLKIGRHVGIICYNDSPLKALLRGGISVFTPDYDRMGAAMAEMIVDKKMTKALLTFNVIHRQSL